MRSFRYDDLISENQRTRTFADRLCRDGDARTDLTRDPMLTEKSRNSLAITSRRGQ
jgi:hypothetical protein